MGPALSDIIERTEERLFGAEDTVCLERARLVTEAYGEHSGELPPVLRALALRRVLEGMTLDLRTNPVFAGNTSSAPRAWMLVPEFSFGVDEQVAVEHEYLKGHLDEAVPEEMREFWRERRAGGTPGGAAGIGHLSVDFDMLVNRGLGDVLDRLAEFEGTGDERRQAYRKGMRIACEAVVMWAGRHADEAARAAEAESDDAVRSCLRRVSDACRRVPRLPARDLFEGLQAMLIVHLATVLEGQGMSVSVGLPDRALARFAPQAKTDPDGARDLVRAFLLGIAANSYQGRGSKTQAVTVGGSDEEGRDVSNAVTLAFLRGFDATPVADPHLFLRWHPALRRETWELGLDMLSRGRSMPLLVNDAQVAPALVDAGVAPRDAWDYCIIGCNELGIPGRSCQSAFSTGLGMNDLEVLDGVLRDAPERHASTEAVVAAYGRAVEARAEAGVEVRRRRTDELADGAPFPFASACCRGCVEAGDDLLRAMPYPDVYGLFVRGTANAVNALAAIEEEGGAQLVQVLATCAPAGAERTTRPP
ncbi:MAG: pyruvate formate lyase family protein [Planctomycetota bacterium]